MTYDTSINVMTNSNIKHETQEIFHALGLDMQSAVNVFLRQVIIHHGLPFKVMLEPNDVTMNAIEGEKFYGPFDSVEDLMRDLND